MNFGRQKNIFSVEKSPAPFQPPHLPYNAPAPTATPQQEGPGESEPLSSFRFTFVAFMPSADISFRIDAASRHQALTLAGRLRDFAFAIDRVMKPPGVTSAGMGSSKDQSPVYMLFYADPNTPSTQRVSFATLHNESSLSVTFTEGLIGLPRSFKGVKWVCIDPDSIKMLCKNILNRLHTKLMKGVVMYINADTRLTVNYSGHLITNTQLSAITDSCKTMYRMALKNHMLPRCFQEMSRSGHVSSTKQVKNPLRITFGDSKAAQLFLDRTSGGKNKRVALFGIEIRVPPSDSMVVLATFKFNPDDLKDNVEISHSVYAERINLDASSPDRFDIKILSDKMPVPEFLISAVKDSSAKRQPNSASQSAPTAAAEAAREVFGVTCETSTQVDIPMPKTASAALEQYLRNLRESKKKQPRACVFCAVLVPTTLFSGPQGSTDSDSSGKDNLKITFSTPCGAGSRKNDVLSSVVQSEWQLKQTSMVHYCTSTFMGSSCYSKETLAAELWKQLKRYSNLEESDEEQSLVCHRVCRALKRFTDGNDKGVFSSARSFGKKKKRKLISRSGDVGPTSQEPKRSRTQSS